MIQIRTNWQPWENVLGDEGYLGMGVDEVSEKLSAKGYLHQIKLEWPTGDSMDWSWGEDRNYKPWASFIGGVTNQTGERQHILLAFTDVADAVYVRLML